VGAFTDAERNYLNTQPLMRFASSSVGGRPDVATVAFSVDGDTIVTSGFDISKTVRFRNIGNNPRASVVVDDLASTDPWAPRGVKVYGAAQIEDDAEGQRFRISPEVIWSWGINEVVAGIPAIARRTVDVAND
jgi:pyridoxamine 5'-phosphate oxidase family protein